ncbi:hypothetical protein CEE34_00020 [Candidatus Aerophobetes bacterium Ae_b3a]|nr:MAG: hypothetical protein CEE34_00020 [Candidatus Aerophobetes bacterium Ae_b3a]
MGVHIEEINLKDKNSVEIPNNKISFVMVHPALEGKLKQIQEGFRFSTHQRTSQVRLIQNTFSLVTSHPSVDVGHTHFLIFPELSVPEEALGVIEEELKDEELKNIIVMGGLEYINGKKFCNLLKDSNIPTKCKNLPATINAFIVNTAFIFIKTNRGNVKRYYQPKISSSPPEQLLQNQYRGSYLLLFKTNSLNFTQIICFDAIAIRLGALNPVTGEILSQFKKIGTSNILRIDLMFVLQHNPDPNNSEFQAFAKRLLEEGERNLIIDALIFANSGAEKYSDFHQYGKSRFYFKRGNYQDFSKSMSLVPDTFSIIEKDRIKHAQFREDGPCCHTFIYYPPWTGGTSSGAYRLPFDRAFVYRITQDGSIEDGKPINGLQKRVFDFLPEGLPGSDPKNRWTANKCQHNKGLNRELKEKYSRVRDKLLMNGIEKTRIGEITSLLFLGYDRISRGRGKINNPDFWEDDYEGEGLKDLASGLTIFETLGMTILQEKSLSKVHTALFSCNDLEFYIALLDDANEITPGQLKEKYKGFLTESTWQNTDWTKNTLLLLCTGNRSESDDLVKEENKYSSIRSNDQERFTSPQIGSLYAYSLDKLRGDLERNCDETKKRWRRKLEPLRS